MNLKDTMRTIDYTLIGTIPEVEIYHDKLPSIILEFQARSRLRSNAQERFELMALGALIEMCAAHFYGIVPGESESMASLIDAIVAADQDLEAK